MPKCPNCGLETKRTLDWACQWCGHPLASRRYRPISKTYGELQEERSGYVSTEAEEEEVAISPEPEEAPEEALSPEPEIEPAPRPEPPPAQPAPPEPPPSRPEPQPQSPPPPAAAPESRPQPAQVPESQPPPAAEPPREEQPPPAPEPAPSPPPATTPRLETGAPSGTILTTADDLAVIFARDSAAANAVMKDKVVRVSGVVEKIFAKPNLDIFYIVLTGSGGQTSWQVRCTFDREQGQALSRLNVGQAETVQGRYAGYEKNIILKDCSLVR